MLFSRYGFDAVDTSEAFVKQALKLGKRDVVLSVTHETGAIEIAFSPIQDIIEATVYHFLDDETELKYCMPSKNLAPGYVTELKLTSAIHEYLAEAYKVADMFSKTTRQSTSYAN